MTTKAQPTVPGTPGTPGAAATQTTPTTTEPPLNGFRGSADGQPIGGGTPPAAAAGDEEEEEDGGGGEPEANNGQPQVVGRGGGVVPPDRVSDVRMRAANAERSRLWKELFGTDNPEEVKRIQTERDTKLKEHEALRTAEEERKRAAMTEQERLQTDLNRVNEENRQLKEQLQAARADATMEKQDARITQVAVKYIRPERIRYARTDLAAHVLTLTPSERKRFGAPQLEKWFKGFVKDNPDFGVKAAEPAAAGGDAGDGSAAPGATNGNGAQPAKAAPQPKRRVISAPKPPQQRQTTPSTATGLEGLTPRPGQPNSMNPKQLKQYMEGQGLKKSW